MDPILQIARERGLRVVEDAAAGSRAEYCPKAHAQGKKSRTDGRHRLLLLLSTKNLGAFGDAGMIRGPTTPVWRRKIRILRVHGSKPKYYHPVIGVNSRLDSLQAAILLVKLKYLDGWTAQREKNALRYQALFQQLPSPVPAFSFPTTENSNRHIFNQYVVRLPQRDAVSNSSKMRGSGPRSTIPFRFHLQPCYSFLN